MLSWLGSLTLWKRPRAEAQPCASQYEQFSRSTAPCENDEDDSSSEPTASYQTSNNKLSKLLSLPNEILQEVMFQCGSSDLISLACTSSAMQRSCLPVLYHNVDISCHNDTGLFRHFRPDNGMVLGNNPNRVKQFHPTGFLLSNKLRKRQQQFVVTILSQPSLGALVRTFTWTYYWHWEIPYITSTNLPKLWAAFLLLTGVETLDICFFYTDGRFMAPHPLFPTARTIRIGGRMPYIFFRSFLSNPCRVISLDIDNPQGFFQGNDGYFSTKYSTFPNPPETEDEDGYPLLRHYGPMRGHLHPLLNRFENLRRLFIRTVGQDDSTDEYYLTSREKSRYAKIAMFISSTAGTLETLVFEQGIIQEGRLTGSTVDDPRVVHQVGRPMDTYFLEFIHPIFLSTEWKKLKKMTIRGVGGKPRGLNGWRLPQVGFRTWEEYDPAILGTAEESLRTSLGEGVLLEWEPEVGKTFYQLC